MYDDSSSIAKGVCTKFFFGLSLDKFLEFIVRKDKVDPTLKPSTRDILDFLVSRNIDFGRRQQSSILLKIINN